MKKVITFKPSPFLDPKRVKPLDLFPEEIYFNIEKILQIDKNCFINRRESSQRVKAEESIIKSISSEVQEWHAKDLFLLFEYFKRIDEYRTFEKLKSEGKLSNAFLSILLRKDPGTITEVRIIRSERISRIYDEKILQAVFPKHNSKHLLVMYTDLLTLVITGNWNHYPFGNLKEIERYRKEDDQVINEVFNIFIGRYKLEDHPAYFPKLFHIKDKKEEYAELIQFRRQNPFTDRVYFIVEKVMYFDPKELKWKVGGGNGYNHTYKIVRHYSCTRRNWDNLVKTHCAL